MKKSKKKKNSSLKSLDKTLLFITIIFCAFGLVMILSASHYVASLQYNYPQTYFFIRQLGFVIIGAFLSIIIYKIPSRYYKLITFIYMLLVTISLIYLKIDGSITNNAQSWFRIPLIGFRFQPSEFAKTGMILLLAVWYGSIKKFNNWGDLVKPLIPCILIFVSVATEPDLGTALIIMFIAALIFYALPLPNYKPVLIFRILGIVGVIGIVVLLNLSPTVLNKFLTHTQAARLNYKNPCSRYLEETGYQVCNGYIAINNGQVFGVGLGKSTQKYLYLPESHTDSIFPIIVEETGLIGGGIILLMYIVLLYKILTISANAKNLTGSIIAFGTFAYILGHLIVNLGGALALIPLTGVPLPFLSYGGSYMINLLILLAFTQRVAIETKERVTE